MGFYRVRNLFFLLTIAIAPGASAQTLFTYGHHAVSKKEFLKAYNKNNGDSNALRLSYADYLDLYAKFKMKVQAALDAKMDTLPQQVSELNDFHRQLADNFLREDASIQLLTDEAVRRSQKDIRLSHIFIPAPSGSTDEEMKNAGAQIKSAYDRLTKGEPFEKVAAAYNSSEIGYITVFVLPYELENIAYTTPIGKFSQPYQSRAGFHIFKPTEERKALGKIRVAQILLAFPPGSTEQDKQAIGRRADSVYNALTRGDDFGTLARQLSNDNLSYQAGGELPAFGVGRYDPVFEKAAFSLAKDGDIGKPFQTSFGYHILKRIQRIPIVEDIHNKEWTNVIKEEVLQSDRMKTAHAMLLKKIHEAIRNDASPEEQHTDTAAFNYYRDHLEKYNPGFAEQLNEFRQGNLLFYIMQKNVWDAASADSVALLNYYNQHKNNYWWENSADALIFNCPNRSSEEDARRSVKANFLSWKEWAASSNGAVQIDSGRFELGQIPGAEKENLIEGAITASVANELDSSMSFAYIIRLYREKEPKKFEDAKGAVISDYQNFLEAQWLNKLNQKYPLKINKKVFRHLPKNT